MKKLTRGIYIYKKRGIRSLVSSVYNKFTKNYRKSDTCPLPDTITLEIGRMCNLRCKMCWRRAVESDGGHLSFEKFKGIMERMDFISRITFGGLAEPLMNPDFFKMIDFCDKNDIMVDFTTNAMLLDEEKSRKILSSKSIENMAFSFDSYNPVVYEKIRVGAEYDIAKRNIEEFSELRKGNYPTVNVSIVGMKMNIKELKDVIQFARRIGAKTVGIGQAYSCNKETSKQRLPFDYSIEDIRKYIKENGMDYIGSLGSLNTKTCTYPWKQPYIMMDGTVKTCSFIGKIYSRIEEWFGNEKIAIDSSYSEMGNVFKDSFESIWNSEKYRTLRRLHGLFFPHKIDLKNYIKERRAFDGKFPNYCKICQFRHRMGC